MPKAQADIAIAVLEDYCRLYAGEALAPVLRAAAKIVEIQETPSLNREGREHPSYDNPLDPFASPDRLPPPYSSAVPSDPQSALKLDLKAARDAVRDEVGSRLCHLTPHGTLICSRQSSSTCLCEETARAALCSQAPVSEGEPSQPAKIAIRDALSLCHRALVAFKDAVIASDHFKGREYVGLGIQVNDAIDKARIALSETGR
jgi:hypothetical protein